MIDLSGIRIMIIDDARTITRAAQIYLEGPKEAPTGIIIKTMPDGFDAISEIMKFKPHIILLDVNMERVDGFAICAGIKQNPELCHIKVIMLTGKDGIFARARGMRAGADAYVLKPFQRDQLLNLVAEHAPNERI
jgi:twitching motility two-component system response regulator PilG